VTTDEELNVLDTQLRRLKIEYEIYFSNPTKKPPTDIEWKVLALLRKFSDGGRMNFSQRFRYNEMAQRYAIYSDLWRKKSRIREEGYRRPQDALLSVQGVRSAEDSAKPQQRQVYGVSQAAAAGAAGHQRRHTSSCTMWTRPSANRLSGFTTHLWLLKRKREKRSRGTSTLSRPSCRRKRRRFGTSITVMRWNTVWNSPMGTPNSRPRQNLRFSSTHFSRLILPSVSISYTCPSEVRMISGTGGFRLSTWKTSESSILLSSAWV